MNNLFIHKPVGIEIPEHVRLSLVKKYKGFWSFAKKDDHPDAEWELPRKIIFIGEMENTKDIFSSKCESVIHLSTSNSPKDKKTHFFLDEDNRENCKEDWIMGFMGECDLFVDTWQGCKHSWHETCKQKIFTDFILAKLSNASILKTLSFFSKDQAVDSIVISNGVVNCFFENVYEEGGVKYSNLEFENDLTPKAVEAISTIIAWTRFEKNKKLDVSSEINKLKNEPHRFLKKLMRKLKAEKFVNFFLTS